MGYGEYVGNMSVHWRVVHEEYTVGDAAGAAPAKSMKSRTERARLRTENVPEDRPATHVGNLDVLDFEARGKDTVVFDEIGRCCGTKKHQKAFRVTMRFRTEKEARAALKGLRPRRKGKMFELIVDVPVIQRPREDVGPPANPPAEVRVDW